MPNIGWAYIASTKNVGTDGFTGVSYNKTTLTENTIIPEGAYSVLYGPMQVAAGAEFTIEQDAIVKIRDIDDF